MDKRCNLVDDCPDSSDEKDCDVLYFPRDYRSELFPITATGDPLSVTLNVSILAFPDISTLQMSFLCDYNLLMRWVDPRLQFYNLVDTFALNSLSASKQAQLWTPILSFPNARQAEGSLVDSGSNTVALKLGSPLEDDISRSVEAFIYEGVDSPLVMTRYGAQCAIGLIIIIFLAAENIWLFSIVFMTSECILLTPKSA